MGKALALQFQAQRDTSLQFNVANADHAEKATQDKALRRGSRTHSPGVGNTDAKETSEKTSSQPGKGARGKKPAQSSKERSADAEMRPSKERPQSDREIDSEILGGLRSKFHQSRTSTLMLAP